MPSPTRGRAALALTAGACTAALLITGSPAVAAGPDDGSLTPIQAPVAVPGRYIVTLVGEPIATYDGNLAGLDATRPEEGEKVDVTTTAAREYEAHLMAEQDAVAEDVGVEPDRRYAVSLNGFVADLDAEQARELEADPAVLSVSKDELLKPTDDRDSTDFLRLSGEDGVWESLGGTEAAGRGVVIGILDTGFWPESESFAGEPLATRSSGGDPYLPYLEGDQIVVPKSDGSDFTGTCQTGEEWTADLCTTKIVGARYFGDAWLQATPEANRRDFISPRDGGGHGTHVGSTAAGNHDVEAAVEGYDFGSISGVAPAATLANYKVLWEGDSPQTSGGFTSDIVQAVDAAVSDGVDVINYSIGSGSESPLTSPINLAFLSAASAGIFISASAGNSGPGASTMDNTPPWVTTVAASTVAPYEGTVQLANGEEYAGISTTTVGQPVGPAPLVNAADVGMAGANPAEVALCYPGTLDPEQVAGHIVVCDRGIIARVDKSVAVEQAGGVGMVLVNLTEQSLDGDLHSVPTVHVNPPASQEIKAYAGTEGAEATLVEGNLSGESLPYPQVASFSSRGPSLQNDGDLLKPDLAAPGVSILAAVAPPSNGGQDFAFYNGTSMAAPHVAGAAALILGEGQHPLWSAMQVKSAVMTSATDLVDADGSPSGDVFAQGAGNLTPTRMFDPGLVYDSADEQWLGYLEGLGVATGTGVDAIDPSNYNAPSIAIGSLLQRQTVTRQVTATEAGLYRATSSVPGMRVQVSPSILNFDRAGETKSYRVTFTRTSAPYDQAAMGNITWSGAGTTSRIPVAVTPKQVEAPEQVSGTGRVGSVSFEIDPGVDGRFPIRGYGLTPGEATSGELGGGQRLQVPVQVAEGTRVAQFSVRSEEQAADLDLAVFRLTPQGAVLVGRSATAAADETVTLIAPEAGTYVGLVENFANAPGQSSTAFTHRAALVGPNPGPGRLRVTPANPTARVGTPIEVTAAWSRVDPSVSYLGWIEYLDGSGTVLTVN